MTTEEFAHGGYMEVQKRLGEGNKGSTILSGPIWDEDTLTWMDAGRSVNAPSTPYSPDTADWAARRSQGSCSNPQV